jgi:2,4-dienoyl-CoA reductase-like NADH-dependent reductase (Old Yellow Enzyme family)
MDNRSRFAVEVVNAVVEAVGAERTALRLSPLAPLMAWAWRIRSTNTLL